MSGCACPSGRELLAQEAVHAIEPRAGRPQRTRRDSGDFLVTEPFDICEPGDFAEFSGERVGRLLHFGVRDAIEEMLLRTWLRLDCM